MSAENATPNSENTNFQSTEAQRGRHGSKASDLVIVDEHVLEGKIHVVRGQKVMLDFDLAEIYGYSTKAFNQQVKNNIEKFDADFRFRITREELDEILRSKILTSRDSNIFAGQSGGTRYLPYAFTEQGVYMLMTVLKGDLATRQSKALVRLFKRMKDQLIENRQMVELSEFSKVLDRITADEGRILEVERNVFIIMDRSTDNEHCYFCGPSSKDAGKGVAAIVELPENDRASFYSLLIGLEASPVLELPK